MTTPEVVVLGAAGLDTTVSVDGFEFEHRESRFTSVVDGIGHAGGYAARLYAAAGRTVSYVGGIGDDPAGREIRRVFDLEGVDMRGVFQEPRGTARSVNLALSDGRRRSFYDGRLGGGHPDRDAVAGLVAGARLVHVNLPEWVRPLLAAVRETGAVIACDLQDLPSPDDVYRADFIAAADILFFSGVDLVDPRRAMEGLWQRNPQATIVAGLGSEGALLGIDGQVERHPAPRVDLPIVDTTGAGDSLAVGFLLGRVFRDESPIDGLLRGQVTARHTCSLSQPKHGFAAPEEIDDLMGRATRP